MPLRVYLAQTMDLFMQSHRLKSGLYQASGWLFYLSLLMLLA